MQIQPLLRERLAAAIAKVAPGCDAMSDLVRPTQDPRFGDFQINAAMPIAKQLKTNPREIAQQLLEALQTEDLCSRAEVAGPGFINLTLNSEWIGAQATASLRHERLGVEPVESPATIVIDYSSPNVAKPMHVGHIRSSCIGDALARVMRFLGHRVITDNHLGDWGTQFGMVIYGYRHFLDADAFRDQPVAELLRMYRIVNTLIDYRESLSGLEHAERQVGEAKAAVQSATSQWRNAAPDAVKRLKKSKATAEKRLKSAEHHLAALRARIEQVEADPQLREAASEHPQIAQAVLEETAKLHAGDEANRQLWENLLPHCMDEINRVYRRLDIDFDYVLGESFYHPMLPQIVEKLSRSGLATESEGAVCVFLPEFDSPMIVQKKDGAFLYATTDLATIEYRQQTFQPDEILYVVDFRQGEHFQKLFAAARLMGYEATKFEHVSFGTVLGEDGRPLKTRSGTLAGLTSLLDDAVQRASEVVCNPDRTRQLDPPLSEREKSEIAECVGIGAIKYADLAHHRTSDYKFSLDKMVALDGNTSAYVQYAYARIQGILRTAGLSEEEVIARDAAIRIDQPAERALVTTLLNLEAVLQQVRTEYAPNLLVDFLYEVSRGFATMYEQCPVLKAETEAVRDSRLAIITLAARTLREGLRLLGIGVVPRM